MSIARDNIEYRSLFIGVDSPVYLEDKTMIVPIGFDNGATTPSFKSAYNAFGKSLLTYGAVARGTGQKSEVTTQNYEDARKIIMNFFNVDKDDRYTTIFGKTTTECINILANALIKDKSEKVLTTRMEHHANDLPWRHVAAVEYVEVDQLGRLKIEEIEEKLKENKGEIKYVSITGASNVTGYINPVHEIASICHKYNAKIIVDAAQLVAHKEIDMLGNNDDNIDFLVFSSHKVYAPYGIGVIVGLKDELSNMEPFVRGGGCVKVVLDDDIIWSDAPSLHEGGSPNSLGAIATARALQQLNQIGMDNIFNHERNIKEFIIRELKKIDKVILYGDNEKVDDRLGIVVFNIEGQDYKIMGKRFAQEIGIALRVGKFCAHPYVCRLLGIGSEEIGAYIDNELEDLGMIRISLGLYNTMREAEIFIGYIKSIVKNL
ncbi:MAG: aminotransferase class V-fold PLP-dependent enzyme [Terrisporobacter sp.]|uniref:aminotransferase class V-fold PLP-dependent enzyme n=1 Tax=Terrisporobacter sp. TaxID=1965305 RepID=UPI002FC6F7E0